MTLGQILKASRGHRGLTLRAVEDQTGISNGYLSQLESDSIKTPSPRHLHQLSQVYDVDYANLMTAAGYALPTSPANSPWDTLGDGANFAAGFVSLSQDDRAKVLEYMDFIRTRAGA